MTPTYFKQKRRMTCHPEVTATQLLPDVHAMMDQSISATSYSNVTNVFSCDNPEFLQNCHLTALNQPFSWPTKTGP